MKRTRQITISHCGPAVLESLFSFVGLRISQTGIVKSIRAQKKIRKLGLNMKDLAKSAKFTGKGEFLFWAKYGAKISDIETIIGKYKFPVGVEWQGVFYEDEDEDNGHYSIITKIDKKSGYLRIADPYKKYAGVDRRFKIKNFKKRWWDTNIIRDKEVMDKKVIFVITPKGETWPKKLGMKK